MCGRVLWARPGHESTLALLLPYCWPGFTHMPNPAAREAGRCRPPEQGPFSALVPVLRVCPQVSQAAFQSPSFLGLSLCSKPFDLCLPAWIFHLCLLPFCPLKPSCLLVPNSSFADLFELDSSSLQFLSRISAAYLSGLGPCDPWYLPAIDRCAPWVTAHPIPGPRVQSSPFTLCLQVLPMSSGLGLKLYF